MNINIISALCKNGGIGYKNALPWYYSKDLKFFAQMTKNKVQRREKSAVLMGRNTWNSLPKPLPNRSNYIISSSMVGDNYFNSIDSCLEHCRENKYSNAWIIGGANIYSQAIHRNDINYMYLTRINKEYTCDTFFPSVPNNFICISRYSEIENDTELIFEIYKNLSKTYKK